MNADVLGKLFSFIKPTILFGTCRYICQDWRSVIDNEEFQEYYDLHPFRYEAVFEWLSQFEYISTSRSTAFSTSHLLFGSSRSNTDMKGFLLPSMTKFQSW